jgi:asparagine synthase (glutamine-hydrolysing)
MCGIAGAIGKFSQVEADNLVQSMTRNMDHRGPDDRGCQSWMCGKNVVALGNTRLSILDLSAAGHQPMTECSGRYWIIFNGEIYNFHELRKLLDPGRELFRTSSDTEAILYAYRRWSDTAFSVLRGMFAFALLDTVSRQVHLVRDPLGIKPLYYYTAGGKLLFASEVRALLQGGQVPRRINPQAVSHFLGYGWVGKSGTAISGIKLLQPGHVLTADLGAEEMKLTISRYEPEISFEGRPQNDRNESTGHLLHLLEQSVKCHLLSDVPVGVFLSGGIDSTAILHLMRQAGCNAPRTFTVAFSESDFTEHQFARQVARRYDAQHHELHLADSDLLEELPAALAAMDQPTMDGVNTFVIANAVHSTGIKVALSGLGSDELFAGYPSFRRARWAKLAAKAPLRLRVSLAAAGKAASSGPRLEKFWDLLASDCTPLSSYRISRRLFASHETGRLLQNNILVPTPADPPFSADEINEVSKLEASGYMTDLLLRDTDFMSMANSLEVRVPFIDKALIRFVLQLPGDWKLARSSPKALLLDAMRGAIPAYVWRRRKLGFVLPFDRWMRSTLRPTIEETLANRQLAEAVGLSLPALHQTWRRFLEGTVRWSQPWSLFVLMRWCEQQRASI